MSSDNIPDQHPLAAFKRVSKTIGKGEITLSKSDEQLYEKFMAFKLTCAMSDEAAATLCLASALFSHTLDVNARNC